MYKYNNMNQLTTIISTKNIYVKSLSIYKFIHNFYIYTLLLNY